MVKEANCDMIAELKEMHVNENKANSKIDELEAYIE